MKKLTKVLPIFFVFFGLTGAAAQTPSSIILESWTCADTPEVEYLNVGGPNRKVAVPYTANWPSDETREVYYQDGGGYHNIGQISGGYHILEVQYDAPTPGYWEDYELYVGVVGEQNTRNLRIFTEPRPSLVLDVADVEDASGSVEGKIITFNVSSETGYSNISGWGSWLPSCEFQTIMIVTKATVGTEVVWVDTIFCTPGIATFQERSFFYSGEGGLMCIRSFMKRVADEYHTYEVKQSNQECFDVEGISTLVYEERDSNTNMTRVFPNPSKGGDVTVQSELPIANWRVYDTTGKMVAEENVNELKKFNIPTAALNPGMYFIQTQSLSGNTSTIRLIQE